MIVREVRLENIKSYGAPAEVIHLSRGVNAICGANGSGKSTILEAVGCALFQHLPYGHDQFVREGQKSGTITVVVESRFDQRTYEVVRQVGRNRGRQYVYDPEIAQIVAQGEADVRRWLHQHLQIPDEVDLASLFVDAVGPLQGTLTAPFLEGSAERKLKFNRLLRVQEYDEAWAKLRGLDNALGDEEQSLKVRISKLEGQTTDKASLELQRAAKVDEQARLGLQLSRSQAERDDVDRRLDAFRAGQLAWQTATNQLGLAQERERHALASAARAQADWEASRLAADRCAQTADDRASYDQCEKALVQIDEEQRQRDELRTEAATLIQTRTRRQAELDHAAAEVDAARQAAARATELEARIPDQVAAEARVDHAREAKREAEDIRRRYQTTYERGVRAKQIKDRAQAELELAVGLLPLLEEYPSRQAELEARARELAEATRADGQQAELRKQVLEANQREAELRARRAELDRNLAALHVGATPPDDSATLQSRLTEAAGQHAAAQSSLKHARTTRIQVAGGLCPLLHETCQNLRPGVTLERHFDEEIERWNREVAQRAEQVVTIDRSVKVALAAEQRLARAAEVERELARVETDLRDQEARSTDARARLRDAAARATSLTTFREAERAARDDVARIDAARPRIERIPQLTGEVAELTADLDSYRAECRRDRERLDALKGIDAELEAAREALAALEAPRESAAHLRAEARHLEARTARQVELAAAVEALQVQLVELQRRLEPYTGLDERARALRARREACRPAFEAYLAAAPIAALLDERQARFGEAEAESTRATAEREHAAAALDEASRAYRRDDHERAEARRRELDHAIAATRAQIDAAVREVEQLEARLAVIARLQQELDELQARLDAIAEERQIGAALRNAIRAAGPEITRQLLTRISRTASRINAEILTQSGIELEWTPEYEIITRRGTEQRGFAQLSGGEQMAAALAVRLAVLRDLSNIRIAFLDEPTAHLDQERRTNLGDQVQRLQGFDQLVVISHDDTFDGLFGHVVRVGHQNGQSHVVEAT